MATTLQDIARFLNEEKFRFTMMEDHVRLSFSTDNYAAPEPDGERSLFLVVKLEEEGEYFKLIAPCVYRIRPDEADPRAFQALLQVSWKTKMVQFEYDDSDGEVRAIIEFPLEDSELTKRQLMRCLNGMVQIIEEYHPAIEAAMLSGSIDFGLEEEAELARLAREALGRLGPGGRRPARTSRGLRLEE